MLQLILFICQKNVLEIKLICHTQSKMEKEVKEKYSSGSISNSGIMSNVTFSCTS